MSGRDNAHSKYLNNSRKSRKTVRNVAVRGASTETKTPSQEWLGVDLVVQFSLFPNQAP